MNRLARQRAVAHAERRLARECDDWHAGTDRLRAHLARHRARWLLGSGFVAGIAFEWLPLRSAGNLARLCVGIASFALRLPFGSLLAQRLAVKTSAHSAEATTTGDSR